MNLMGIYFANPIYLKFIAIPLFMFCVWLWRFFSRRFGVGIYRKRRIVPFGEQYLLAGKLLFWFCVILSITSSILALSRPQKLISSVNKSPVDLVIIQDGSASMSTKDVMPDRWGRSMVWLRTLVETLPWKGDRLALAAFAHKASPMIRLTSDPNVVMFFMDHLKKSPFPIFDDTTWDTNIYEGMYWGLKILEKDFQIRGKKTNPAAFVLISDGQVWSGQVELLFKQIRNIGPVYVIGVGTTTGGVIPEPKKPTVQTPAEAPVYSSLDRQSLRNIAIAGGGEYFELGVEPDASIATRIVNQVQRRNTSGNKEESWQDLYWYFLLTTAVFIALGIYALSR